MPTTTTTTKLPPNVMATLPNGKAVELAFSERPSRSKTTRRLVTAEGSHPVAISAESAETLTIYRGSGKAMVTAERTTTEDGATEWHLPDVIIRRGKRDTVWVRPGSNPGSGKVIL